MFEVVETHLGVSFSCLKVGRKKLAMADRRVDCANVRQKYPRREGITHLGGTSAKADVISDIQSGTHTYHTFAGGVRAKVRVEGGELVATTPDNTRANNLLSLPDC